ncbi:FMN-dependent oxidoreductase (nitrilotriacetate monooxygenase family) [Mycolicibacterium sp. BK634]|uniref:NtaA/DmoA family FMN-dependent monooxygenase n=1 Tax=Mycolicibacterium sp. BK634 TaxID=2587099 RepID=UPI0016174E80|nr:NtaA/DmoA family FMN-dependent monooxygenase [Mycolicibacterium sp. BK634]MBB3752822.1 FMN-dependent oxidoreductase (nitrilotriacetate monooxygenase family) [Mycolicibacterium sp. BK634]
MAKKMHLGWFMNYAPPQWLNPFDRVNSSWANADFHIEMAKMLEGACFDYLMIEDTLMVSNAFGNSTEAALKHALQVPKLDATVLAGAVVKATTKLGVIATASILSYPPFTLARMIASLDHLSDGRFGWNIVTSGEEQAAHNVGLDTLPPRQVRYDMADEFVEVVTKLLASWDEGAVVMDRESGTYVDHTKVHEVNFVGKFYKSRGPLNVPRTPQGRPVYLQAGGSPRGRQFAAETADSIVAIAEGIDGMIDYRNDIRARAQAAGRNPDDIKVMFLVTPVLGDSAADAEAKRYSMVNTDAFITSQLGMISTVTDIDFSSFPLDEELPPLTTNGEQGSLNKFMQAGSGKTLRELATTATGFASCLPLVGTPADVAAEMADAMEAVGGDGFLLTTPLQHLSRRYVTDITEGLVPALRDLGVVRESYEYDTLRENLLAF